MEQSHRRIAVICALFAIPIAYISAGALTVVAAVGAPFIQRQSRIKSESIPED